MSKDKINKFIYVLKYIFFTILILGILGILVFYVYSLNSNFRKYEFKFSSNAVNLYLGKDGEVPIVSIDGDSVDKNNYSFTSSDSSIVKVDSKGIITPVRAGNTVIVVKAKNSRQKELLHVNVIGSVNVLSIEDIKLSTEEISIKVDEVYTIDYEIVPKGATIDKMLWSSSNTGIVSVDNGVLTGKAKGSCAIFIKCGNISKEIVVNVSE